MDLRYIRRELHQIPELAFQEVKTRDFLLEQLRGLKGIKIHKFERSTGLLVEYNHGDGPYRLFRADMDALPVAEKTECGYISHHEGVMHACGHDVHMTVLLGLIAAVVEDSQPRNLLFLFQPAEEGQGGAESVLAEGLIQSFPVDKVHALHVKNGLQVGTVSSRAGVFFGIPQEFDVRFTGKASHAAYPELGINALTAGTEFLALMRKDVEALSARARAIFHVGKVTSGTVRNVVPDFCLLEGTHRTLSKQMREQINGLILANAAQAASASGAGYEVDFLCSYDPVVNDAALLDELKTVCGTTGVGFQEAEIALTGEDFGFFTTLYPGLLFWLGAGCEYPLHSDRFLADEACIDVGVKVFRALASL